MSQITVTPRDFFDVVVNYLLDITTDNPFKNDPDIDTLVKKIKNSGLRSNLFTFFLDEDGINRVKYKMIRKILLDEVPSGEGKISVNAFGEHKE
jgi:hypothetical protein